MGLIELLLLAIMVCCAFTSYRIGYIEGSRDGVEKGVEGVWSRCRKKGIIPANISMDKFIAKITEGESK